MFNDLIFIRKSRHEHNCPFFKEHYLVLPDEFKKNCNYLLEFKKQRHDCYTVIEFDAFRFNKYQMEASIAEQCPFLISFVPIKADLGKFPLPFFKGYIKKGDKLDL